MAVFGPESERQLATCHPELQRLFREVVRHWDCKVLEGKRSEEQQRIYFAKGVSRTLASKHVYPLESPSLAVDVAPYPVDWKDTIRFYAFGGFVLGVASQLGVRIRHGADWDGDRNLGEETFRDLPHFELVSG